MEWTNVKDGIPAADYTFVDVWSEGERVADLVWIDDGWYEWNNNWVKWVYPVTHWMVIEEPEGFPLKPVVYRIEAKDHENKKLRDAIEEHNKIVDSDSSHAGWIYVKDELPPR